MKHFLFYTGIFLLLFLNCSRTKETKNNFVSSNESNYFKYLSNLKLPEKLSFCGESVPLDIEEVRERAEREFYLFLQTPGQVILYMKRAGRYFPVYDKIFKEMNLPTDLKYLSVCESALYMSRSTKDAVGLWQIIPATAKKLGLQVDDYVDERRHPEKSTEAAMKYLKSGFDSSKSWMLAAAGYNMGHENVKDNTDFQNSKDFFDLFLNEETSRYILRIVVIKEIMEAPEKYGFALEDSQFYKPDNVKYIKVKYAISNLAEWAKKIGTSYKYVKLLNPWILKRELPAPKGDKVYEIAVPK